MFRYSRPALSLAFLLTLMGASGAVAAEPNGAAATCADPAIAAAIDRKEAANIEANKLPGSGIALSSFDALARSGVRMTGARAEVLGGDATADATIATCRVKLHVVAQTPQGAKEAEEEFAYRIERVGNGVAASFCGNRECDSNASPGKPADPPAGLKRTAQNAQSAR